jgi:N-acetyl-beta-hexosaminidase
LILQCNLCLGINDIIPTPKNIKEGVGYFKLKSKITVSISGNEQLEPAAEYLIQKLSIATGYSFKIKKRGNADIILSIENLPDTTAGAYILTVTPKNIKLTGNNYQGIISAISSLRQLLPLEIEQDVSQNSTVQWEIPLVTIEDAPRFQYRGLMLDVARHYFDKEEVMILLDRMALYKLNKFHWHLTDNEGWRIEIKRYPELTEKGGWRIFNALDEFCEQKAKTDQNPDFNLTKKHLKVENGKTLYGGYYTQEDIKEVVSYAAMLGIDVIPEIDMPGHFNAASEVFPYIICKNPDMHSSPVCMGNDDAIEFCKNIYREVFDLFPYEYVHIGADEVGKENWMRCPLCQARIKNEGLKDEAELQSWFVHLMENYFNKHGKRLIGWDEIIEGGLSHTSTVMWWRGDPKAVLETIAHGNQVIASPNQWLYFDHGQFNHSIKHVYDFEAIPEELAAGKEGLIIGVQANIWSEYIPSMLRMDYMSMPKMLCLSEMCWIDANAKDWNVFSNKIENHIPRLNAMNINYRVPFLESDIFINDRKIIHLNIPPEEWLCDTITLTTKSKTINLQAPYSNIEIRYTTDGTIPTMSSALYTKPFEATEGAYIFATFRPNGTRGEFRKVLFVKKD